MSFAKLATILAVVGIAASKLNITNLPNGFSTFSILSTYALVILMHSFWNIVLAPSFSSFTDLPSPDQGPWYKRFLKEPTPGDLEVWINEIPNDGLIRYFGAFNRESLFITQPHLIKEFLQTNGYKFRKLEAGRNIIEQVTGHGLLVVDGDEHKQQRKSLNPAFKFKFIKDSYPRFWEHAVDFANSIEDQITKDRPSVTIDTDSWLQRVTFDIISDTGFGLKLNAVHDPDNEVVTTLAGANSAAPEAHRHRMLAFLVPRWALWNWPSQRRKELDHMVDVLHDISLPLIKSRRAASEQMSVEEMESDASAKTQAGAHSDIIATLLRSPHANSFDDEFLVAQAGTFLIAGQDTTSVATGWALHLLSQNLDIQDRLRKEIREHLPSPNNRSNVKLDAHLLESLPLLYAVCNEVLRLYAPAPQIRRTCVDPTAVIQGRHIPVGMSINASQWAIQRAKSVWGQDVLAFKPDRFLRREIATGEVKFDVTGGLKGDAAVYGNIPFGAGFRSCIGERFARAEFAALLAVLVGRLEWLPAADTPEQVEAQWGIVTKPAHRLAVQAKRVEGW